MKNLFLLISFLLIADFIISQQVEIKFKNQKNDTKVYLYSFYGNKLIIEDSCFITNKGVVKFNLKNKVGFYRIVYKKNSFDFIQDNHKKIHIAINDTLFVYNKIAVNTYDNQLFFELKYLTSQTNDSIMKTNRSSLIGYEKNTIVKAIEFDFINKVNGLINKNKSSYFSRTAIQLIEPSMSKSDSSNFESNYLFQQNHFFDNIDFNKTDILYSTMITNLIMRYFEKYTEYNEQGFKKSIDYILNTVKVNQEIYQFTLNYLIELFSKVGPEIILEYIIEKYYIAESCNFQSQSNTEISQILKMQVGNDIPDYQFDDSVSIHTICKKNQLTLIVFWSPECSYCMKEIPYIQEIMQKESKLFLISVVLNFNKNQSECSFSNIKNQYQYIAINGFEDDLVKLFNVNKTPTLYLVSNNKIILKKNIFGISLNEFISHY